MAFVTKEWKDRLVEYAGRRKLKNVATGEEIVYDVSRQEGAVSQAGDAFAAETMNDLEQRISDEFNQVNQNLGGFTPVIDATGEITGYKTTVGGADTVFPFSSGASFARMYLGSTSQDEATHYLPIIQLVGSFLSKHSDTGLLVTRDCNATIVLILYTEGGSGVHTSKVMINNAVMLTASPGSLIRTKDIALKKGDIVKSYQQSVKNWYVIGDCYIVAY